MLQETNQSVSRARISARAQSSCFACGPDNERGLRLRFEKNETGEMRAEWIPESSTEGFDGIVHGGIVSTVLDESMSKVVAATGVKALRPSFACGSAGRSYLGYRVQIRGWINCRNKRVFKTEAALTGADGTELAHAWASFLALR